MKGVSGRFDFGFRWVPGRVFQVHVRVFSCQNLGFLKFNYMIVVYFIIGIV